MVNASRHFSKAYLVVAGAAVFYISFIIFADAKSTADQFARIKLEYLALIIGTEIAVLFIRTVRNRFLLRTVGINLPFKRNLLVYLSALAMTITPGGAGEVVRSEFIKRESGRSISSTAPIYFAERLNDLVAVVVIMLLFMMFFPLREGFVVVSVAIAIIITFYLITTNRRVFQLFAGLFRRAKKVQRFASSFDEMHDSFSVILEKKIFGKTWLFSLPIWFVHGLTVYFSFLAFGITSFHILEVYVIYFTSLVIGVLSFIPGGLGITEGSFAGLLALRGLELPTAVALALLIRLSTLWFAAVVGMVAAKILLAKPPSTKVAE